MKNKEIKMLDYGCSFYTIFNFNYNEYAENVLNELNLNIEEILENKNEKYAPGSCFILCTMRIKIIDESYLLTIFFRRKLTDFNFCINIEKGVNLISYYKLKNNKFIIKDKSKKNIIELIIKDLTKKTDLKNKLEEKLINNNKKEKRSKI